ncbi:hypothetical protein BDZ89DRAFT_1139312 [Hymenopellis radicata]|nr:hypothetical protein BDZ89DRAFT_1139312 [Hymenopellis radicata]
MSSTPSASSSSPPSSCAHGTCDCPGFIAFPSNAFQCGNCGHVLGNHPSSKPASVSSKGAPSSSTNTSLSSSKSASSSSKTTQSSSSAPPQETSQEKLKSLKHVLANSSAQSEVNKGLARGGSSRSSSGASSGKTSRSTSKKDAKKDAKNVPDSNIIELTRVIVWPHGLTFNDETDTLYLRTADGSSIDCIPHLKSNANALYLLRKCGLGSFADSQPGIQFNRTSTYKDMTTWLRSTLPEAFNHIPLNHPTPWRLLTPSMSKGKVELHLAENPTGIDVDFARGNQKKQFVDSQLYCGT